MITELVSDETGMFEVSDLPPSTDITLVVSAADDAFVQRAFYLTTPPTPGNNVYRDIGRLSVSEPVTLSVSVSDKQTGDPITGLEFIGLSHLGFFESTVLDYAHRSTFNDVTNQYEIVLPKDLNVSTEAILDLDGDGELDFDKAEGDNVYISADKLLIYDANELETLNILLSKDDDVIAETKTISIRILNKTNKPLVGETFVYDEDGNAGQLIYDETNSLYTAELPFDGNFRLNMGSFVEDEKTYSTGSINVYRTTDFETGDTQLQVSTSGFNSNSFYRIPDTESVQIVVIGREVQATSDLKVIAASTDADNNYALSVYYSEPVNLSEEQVSLSYGAATVITGNEDANDNVPNGTTVVDEVQVNVPISLSKELNDVKMTVTPSEEIMGNTEYRYKIESVSAKSDEIAVTLTADDETFTTPVDNNNVFTVDSLIVDNGNFYSNGAILHTENSAGIESTLSEMRERAYLFLSVSIESLEYLTITVTGYTENNSDFANFDLYNVVENSRVSYILRKILAVSVADNENVRNLSGHHYDRGTTLPNGQFFYQLSLGKYINDNKPSNVNGFAIYYEYRVEGGENQTGELILPVR